MAVNRNSEDYLRRSRIAHGAGAAVGAFIIATVGLAIGVYAVGSASGLEHHSLQASNGVFELTSSAAFGVAATILHFVFSLAGLAGAVIATLFSVVVGALGIGAGVIVALGVISGPLLMVAAVAVLIKRRYFPDVI